MEIKPVLPGSWEFPGKPSIISYETTTVKFIPANPRAIFPYPFSHPPPIFIKEIRIQMKKILFTTPDILFPPFLVTPLPLRIFSWSRKTLAKGNYAINLIL